MITKTDERVEAACAKVNTVCGLMSKDIEVMSDAELGATHGGKSRAAYDLVYEVTGMLESFAGMLKGTASFEDPYSNGWPTAPASFNNKEHAAKAFQTAVNSFVDALKSYDGDLDEAKFKTAPGMMSALSMADLVRGHTLYHSGQLNYIQTMNGDDEFHWM